MSTHRIPLTSEQSSKADKIFEKECIHLVDEQHWVFIDITSGEYLVGSSLDGGEELYRQFEKRFGTESP